MTIRILHIFQKDDSMAHNYVDQLTRAMQEQVETRSTDDTDEALRLYTEWQPHIVHRHGAATLRTQENSIRLVLQPNGNTVTTQHYYAIIARSQMEARRLGLPRTEIIHNPLITRTTTIGNAAEQTMRVYRKVMNTNPLELMDEPTRRMLALLLKAGITGDRRWIADQPQSLFSQEGLRAIDFHHLYIYAEQEGVLPLVERGLRIVDADAPQRQPAESYLPDSYERPASLSSRNVADIVDYVKHNGPTLLLLSDLYTALHHPRLHDDELVAELRSRDLLPFFQSLLQLLAEQTLLEEGFMPCPAVDNRTTAQLRNQLSNHLRL